jgi:hypothetical protein
MIANQIVGVGSVQATAFTPASIANLKAWYDASDTATISLSGSAVTQWNDKSGNTYNLTQGTAARRPSSGVNTLNSKNVITFAGDDVLAASTASNWTFLNNSGGATIFLAAYYDTSAVQTFIFDTSTSTTGAVGFTSTRGSNDKLAAFVAYGTGGQYVSLDSNLQTLTDATAFYWSMKLDNSNGTAANRIKVRVNGGAEQGANTYTNSPSASAPAQPLFLGSYENAGTQGFQGRIAEIIMYSGILSAGDISSVNSYLASKWAL